MHQNAYLVLENGKVFRGKSFGAVGNAVGETVFTTGMAGYLETLTSKNHFGQIVVQTFPLIGNYGIIPPDFESSVPCLSAYIVKHWCREPSNFRSEGTLDAFLFAHNIVGLYGIDTRTLTQTLRQEGMMNSMVTQNPDTVDFAALRAHRVPNAVCSLGTQQPYHATPSGGKHKICVLDYGLQSSLLQELAQRNCDVFVLPAASTPEEILSFAPQGIILSGGAGTPADNPQMIATTKILAKAGIPLFGIDFGHLLLAISQGFTVSKMKCGHHGANQPVRNTQTGRIYMSNQNHSNFVQAQQDSHVAMPWLQNVNDSSCEGLFYKNFPAFSAQFYPGTDTAFLLEQFLHMTEEKAYAPQ